MSAFNFFDNSILKPVVTAAAVAAGEKFIFGNTDMKSIAMYAGAVGASSVAASFIAPAVSPNLGSLGTLVSGKEVGERVVELAFGVGAAWGVNKFVLMNGNFNNWRDPSTMKRIGVLVAAEIAGELASDIVAGRPLNYFA
jgi:hypothetical protein